MILGGPSELGMHRSVFFFFASLSRDGEFEYTLCLQRISDGTRRFCLNPRMFFPEGWVLSCLAFDTDPFGLDPLPLFCRQMLIIFSDLIFDPLSIVFLYVLFVSTERVRSARLALPKLQISPLISRYKAFVTSLRLFLSYILLSPSFLPPPKCFSPK